MTSGIGQVPASPSWRVTSGEQDPDAVDRLLRSLPDWFGIESSIVEYVEAARELPTYLAWPSAAPQAREGKRAPVGLLLAARHFPRAAEIYLMAVEPATHRRGVGRGLVEALEADLIADGVELLQVKTLARRGLTLATTRRGSSTRPWASGRWRRFTAYGPKTRA